MEPTLQFINLNNISVFSRINDYIVSNEIQTLCIGFCSFTLIYFFILVSYMVKRRYRNFAEAFFLSLSIGGALFMVSMKIFPHLSALLNTSILSGQYAAVFFLMAIYALCVPVLFKIVRKWNNNRVYVFED